MLLSKYYLPLLKENPSEAHVKSHQLMLRAGMIRQLSSGIYNWLPFGLKILNILSNKVRQNLDESGLNEVLMSSIQPAELWYKSKRYNNYGKEMLKIKDRHDNELLFSPTNEEVIVDLFKRDIKNYKDLPKNFYQIGWKFRDEIRPRFGVMRGREFLMKDAYSFDIDFDSAKITYDKMFEIYFKIFKSMGLKKIIAVAADNGAIGGDLSHEFHLIANTGESLIYYDSEIENIIQNDELDITKIKSLYAASEEKHNLSDKTSSNNIVSARGIEIGHIFYFDNNYTKAFDLKIANKDGNQIYPYMGSYGIGISRLVAAIIEANHDDRGIIWPEEISPFKVSIINLKINDDYCIKTSNDIYQKLKSKKIDVLYDDTDETVGSKFASNDLIGIPHQIIIGPRSAGSNMVEYKNRRTNIKENLTIEEIYDRIQ